MRQIQAKFLRFHFLFVILGMAFSTVCFSVGEGFLEENGFSVNRAPISCRVTQMLVSKGQHVRKGETLGIVEFMKMEQQIYATAQGKVEYIPYKAGNFVEDGAILASILPWQAPPPSNTPPINPTEPPNSTLHTSLDRPIPDINVTEPIVESPIPTASFRDLGSLHKPIRASDREALYPEPSKSGRFRVLRPSIPPRFAGSEEGLNPRMTQKENDGLFKNSATSNTPISRTISINETFANFKNSIRKGLGNKIIALIPKSEPPSLPFLIESEEVKGKPNQAPVIKTHTQEILDSFSLSPWVKWVCALMILSQLLLVLKLGTSRKPSQQVVSSLHISYAHAVDFNRYGSMPYQTPANMNVRFILEVA